MAKIHLLHRNRLDVSMGAARIGHAGHGVRVAPAMTAATPVGSLAWHDSPTTDRAPAANAQQAASMAPGSSLPAAARASRAQCQPHTVPSGGVECQPLRRTQLRRPRPRCAVRATGTRTTCGLG